MRINLIRQFDGSPPINLGTINYHGNFAEKQVVNIVNMAWQDFQETKPDADSLFAEYLIDNYYYFSINNEPTINISLD